MDTGGWESVAHGVAIFLPSALELLFGATLILLLALLLNFSLRRGTAALRHRLWALSTGGLLLLPLLCPLLPKLSLALNISLVGTKLIPPEPAKLSSSQAAAVASLRETVSAGIPRITRHTPLASSMSPREDQTNSDNAASPTFPPVGKQSLEGNTLWLLGIGMLMLTWLFGIVWGLAATVRSLWLDRRLVKDIVPLADLSWQTLFDELRGQLNVRRTVTLGIGKRSIVPLSVGFWKPIILLPADCAAWTPEKRRAVLIHELSHVARDDVFWQIATRLACVLYWVHPLTWLAARRMRIERERACDDAVLLFGSRPDQYATILLDVAATIRGHSQSGTAAVAMACRKSVEQRIRAILSPVYAACRSDRAAKMLLLGAMLIVAFTAALHPFAPPQKVHANDVLVSDKENVKESSREIVATEKDRAKVAANEGKSSVASDTKGNEPQVVIRGIVVDEKGRPEEGVTIQLANLSHQNTLEVNCDKEGHFEIKAGRDTFFYPQLIARSKDRSNQAYYLFKEDSRLADLEQPVRMVLKPARKLDVRVEDANSEPIEGAAVGMVAEDGVIESGRSNSDGRIAFQIPADAPLQNLYALKSGRGLDYLSFPKNEDSLAGDEKPSSNSSGKLVLKLTGAKTIRLKLIDPEGRPIEGLKLTPWTFQKPGTDFHDELNISGAGDFFRKTDSSGVVEFDWIPAWGDKNDLIFWPYSKSEWTGYRITCSSKQDSSVKLVMLQRLVPVRGRVCHADGRPAEGIIIEAAGIYTGRANDRAGWGREIEDYQGNCRSDERGRFELHVNPDQEYMFVVSDDKWAAPSRTGIEVRTDKTVEIDDFQLQPATRLHGQVTYGPDKTPWAGQWISLDQEIRPRINHCVKTNANGEYSFAVGPGNFSLKAADTTPERKFTITDQKELVFDFHAVQKDRSSMPVRVVDQNHPASPVLNAKLTVFFDHHDLSMYPASSSFSVETTDKKLSWHGGSFGKMAVLASTKDNKLLGSAIVTSNDTELTIPVRPAGSAKGQVIDQATGKPAAKLKILFSVNQKDPTSDDTNPQTVWSNAYPGGTTETDAEGFFEIPGLVPDWKYHLMAQPWEDSNKKKFTIGYVKGKSGETVDLGIVKFVHDD